jgi:glycerol-3-phosphate dehydrogenase (NAD(P)+)
MTQTKARLPVTVLGAGAWGTALASAACQRADVMLWGRDPKKMQVLSDTHENHAYLPDIALAPNLRLTASLSEALEHATQTNRQPGLIVLGTPMSGLRQTVEMVLKSLPDPSSIVGMIWTCKGLDPLTGQLAHELVAQNTSVLPSGIPTGVLSGPSFAKEVAQGLPVALTIASTSESLKQAVIESFHAGAMRIYGSSDLVGVEVGGALKNVMAIACGISDALHLGNNARAALITRGLAEMTRFGLALGAQASTFSGLTGLGDLVLTATGELSRNRHVGLEIGRGATLENILAKGLTAEGARCARAVAARANTLGIAMPITEAVCSTLFGGVAPSEAVARLLARDATEE